MQYDHRMQLEALCQRRREAAERAGEGPVEEEVLTWWDDNTTTEIKTHNRGGE